MQVEQFRKLFREEHNKSEYESFLRYVVEYAQADKREFAVNFSFYFWKDFLELDDNINIILNSRIVELVNNSVIDEIPNVKPDFLNKKRTFSIRFSEPIFYKPENIEFKVKELCFLETPLQDGEKSLFSFMLYHDKNELEVEQMFTSFFVNWKEQKLEYGEEREEEFSKLFLTLLFILYAENAPIQKSEKRTKQDKENKVTSLFVDLDKEYGKKYLGTVSVKGHLRNQAYGAGFSLRKIIYIAPYEYERMLKEKQNNAI